MNQEKVLKFWETAVSENAAYYGVGCRITRTPHSFQAAIFKGRTQYLGTISYCIFDDKMRCAYYSAGKVVHIYEGSKPSWELIGASIRRFLSRAE